MRDRLVPPVWIEQTTCRLQGGCSTTELRRQESKLYSYTGPSIPAHIRVVARRNTANSIDLALVDLSGFGIFEAWSSTGLIDLKPARHRHNARYSVEWREAAGSYTTRR